MKQENKVSVDVPMWHRTSGIRHVRVIGPVEPSGGKWNDDKVYRVEMFMGYPEKDTQPEFYAELCPTDIINLRNALSACLFSMGQ
jgi:hypothetical protein